MMEAISGSADEVAVRLLGTVVLDGGAHPVPAGTAKQCCVLAVLALTPGRPVLADTLVDYVWGEQPPPAVRSALYGYIARLRRALRELGAEPPIGVTKRSGGYVLDTRAERIDVHLMRARADEGRAALAAGAPERAALLLREAASLFRGPPLSGLSGDWAERVREGLVRERISLLGDLYAAELAAGNHVRIVGELSGLVAENPLAESLVRCLMLALYRSGRTTEALACFTDFGRRSRDELGTDPGTALAGLHQRILREDPALLTEDVSGAPAEPQSAPPVPRQLPADVGGFVGRADELKQLDGLPGSSVAVIVGTGGIGKTALAVHWAHEHADRFPDGQLHVNLRGFAPSGAPAAPSAVLHGFLDALGVDPAGIPAELDAKAALYRSVLAERSVLVVLDNARDAAQVEPLLPGGGNCTVLVTSRGHLAGLHVRGAHLVDLDVLSPAEARDLLTAQLGGERVLAEPDVVADLVRWCGGLPLAVSIVVARAAAHPDFPLAVLADELAVASARLDALDAGELTANLRAVFSWSYRALGEQAARVFRLLGLLPGADAALPAVAALAALPVPRTRVLLRELEAAHLVQQHVPGRYRMHDLLRLYAAERVAEQDPPGDQTAAVRRLADFYVHTAHAADRLLYPQRPLITPDPPAEHVHPLAHHDNAAASSWFDAEHETMLATQQLAVAHGLDAQGWLFAWVLGSFHRRRGLLQDSLDAWEIGVAAADRLGDPVARGWAHREAGHTSARVGRHEAALAHLDRALALFDDAGDLAAKAHAHQALAVVFDHHGDEERALAESKKSLALFQAAGDQVWAADMLNAIGWFEARLGDFTQARAHCEEGLALNRKHGHRRSEAMTLDSLGYIVRHLGDYEQAVRYYEAAIEAERELGNIAGEARSLVSLGDAHEASGRQADAIVAWRQGLELYCAQRRTADVERVERKLASLDHAP